MKNVFVSLMAKVVRRIAPSWIYSELAFFVSHHRFLNFNHPQLFNEKLYWLKYYYKHNSVELIQQCYDKYTVREYILDKIPEGGKYLPKLYGYYLSVDDIEFEKMPRKFVIKNTQGCGENIFCFDNKDFDYGEAKNKMSTWIKQSRRVQYGDEAYFFNGNSGIIIEELIETNDITSLCDYRFYCFNGIPKLVSVDLDSNYSSGKKKAVYNRNTYDLNWNLIDIDFGRKMNSKIAVDKPKNLDKMIEIAKLLAADFPFIRVDQYNIDGKIYIGELTFIPVSGNAVIYPRKYRKTFGDLLSLPDWDFKS